MGCGRCGAVMRVRAGGIQPGRVTLSGPAQRGGGGGRRRSGPPRRHMPHGSSESPFARRRIRAAAAAAHCWKPQPQAAASESPAKRRRPGPGRRAHGLLAATSASHRTRPGGAGGSRAPQAHGDAGGADEGGGQGCRHLPRPLRGRAQHEIRHVSSIP